MLLALLLGAFSILLAACDGRMSPATTRPSATATPSLSNVSHVSLGDFQASSLLPMAHGLLIFGTPGSVGDPGDTAPSQNGKPKALYYYTIATRTLQSIVSVPDGSKDVITAISAADDWVVYTIGIDPTSFDDVEQIRAFNVVTHEQRAIATSSGINDLASIATDGLTVALISFVGDNHGGGQYNLRTYDLRTRRAQALGTFPSTSGSYLLEMYVLAVYKGAIFYGEQTFSYGAQVDDGWNGLYQWNPPATQPQRIGATWSDYVVLSSKYIIWDDSAAQNVTLYDRQTGTKTDAWATSCIRPDLSDDDTYIACLDYARRLAVVIQTHTRVRTVLGSTVDDANGAIVSGHVYWIVRDKSPQFGNVLDSWELPSA